MEAPMPLFSERMASMKKSKQALESTQEEIDLLRDEARQHAAHQPSLLAKAQSQDEGEENAAPAVPQFAQKKIHLLSKEALVIKSLLKTCGARVHTCGRRG